MRPLVSHSVMTSARKMWRCPKCSRAFVTRNVEHTCRRYTLAQHFRNRPREVVALYREFVRCLRAAAPKGARLTILPQKTRIAFQARTLFASAQLQRQALAASLVLPRVVTHPRITNVQSGSPRSYLHHFRVASAADLRGAVAAWMRDAWRVGLQLHLAEPPDESAREIFDEFQRKPARTPKLKARPLWPCPKCGKLYVTPNISHACARYTEAERLAGKSEHAVWLYRRVVKMLRECGPVRIVPGKTRIAFQARMRFGGVVVQRNALRLAFLLTRPVEHPRIAGVTAYNPRTFGHTVVIRNADDLDAQLHAWLAESFRVGQQAHLLQGQ
jgi:predicted transport protein/predicted RNA-binding Zn-ribbon protein involved in translation (DUF1610 family)